MLNTPFTPVNRFLPLFITTYFPPFNPPPHNFFVSLPQSHLVLYKWFPCCFSPFPLIQISCLPIHLLHLPLNPSGLLKFSQRIWGALWVSPVWSAAKPQPKLNLMYVIHETTFTDSSFGDIREVMLNRLTLFVWHIWRVICYQIRHTVRYQS